MKEAVVILLASMFVACHQQNTTAPPRGDVRNCQLQANKFQFEVLPGAGWDNLQMEEMGSVVSQNYSKCQMTKDGTYLVPDSTRTIPTKYSNVELFSEVISHWYNYTEMTSRSMSTGGSVGFGSFASISGSYSTSYQSIKKHQVNERAQTVRVQLRHHLYTILQEPDAPLNPVFKSRLMDIASHLLRNRTDKARYQSQLLVRDYGTHYITRVDVGAILALEDQVSKSFMSSYSSQSSSREVKAAASVSFFVKIGADFESKSSSSQTFRETYEKARTYSHLVSHGGPLLTSNFKVNSWEQNLTNNLVAIDRSGNPLHYVITTVVLPEVPAHTVYQVSHEVENAIKQYYKFNTHAGCTAAESPNFSFLANIDDGSCEAKITNLTFGGIYQHCNMEAGSSDNFCSLLTQKNPLTGDFKCPSGYTSVFLHKGQQTRTYVHQRCWQVCDSCGWIWKHRCHCRQECVNYNKISTAIYSGHWCAATGEVPPASGFLFGGLYTGLNTNPITGTQSCPDKFQTLQLGGYITVCVSNDFEWGFKDSVPFSGFFSCVAGNPLAQQKSMMEPPKRCPHGFAQHLAALENNCEINYCIKTNAFTPHGFSPIRRPPFMAYPSSASNETDVMLIISDNGRAWYKDYKTSTWVKTTTIDASMVTPAKTVLHMTDITSSDQVGKSVDNRASGSNGLTNSEAAGLGIGGTLLVGIIILIVIGSYRRFRKKTYREETLPLNGANA